MFCPFSPIISGMAAGCLKGKKGALIQYVPSARQSRIKTAGSADSERRKRLTPIKKEKMPAKG